MRISFLCLALAVLLAAPASATHIIDDFETGVFYTSGRSGTLTDSQSGMAGVIGLGGTPPGQRDVLCTITKANGELFQVWVDPGILALAIPTGANATLDVSYGSYTGFGPLNADLSADGSLDIAVTFSDLAGQVDVTLTAAGTEYTVADLAIAPGGSRKLSVPYASFPGLVPSGNLRDVDGVRLSFSSVSDAWDLSVASITSTGDVPEPATLSLLALGVLAMVRRRQKTR